MCVCMLMWNICDFLKSVALEKISRRLKHQRDQHTPRPAPRGRLLLQAGAWQGRSPVPFTLEMEGSLSHRQMGRGSPVPIPSAPVCWALSFLRVSSPHTGSSRAALKSALLVPRGDIAVTGRCLNSATTLSQGKVN